MANLFNSPDNTDEDNLFATEDDLTSYENLGENWIDWVLILSLGTVAVVGGVKYGDKIQQALNDLTHLLSP